MATIERNEQISYILGGIGAALAIASYIIYAVRYGRRWLARIGLFALVIHPAWSISARGGDCGYFKFYSSIGFTFAIALLLALHIYIVRTQTADAEPVA